jgi:diadenosine tetraphosphate (Ap4A) HIT family hydrolase
MSNAKNDKKSCVFCKTIERGGPDVLDIDKDSPFIVLLDIFPVVPGHALIVPRRHIAEYGGLTQAERYALTDMVIRLYDEIRRTDLVVSYDSLLAAYRESVPKSVSFLRDARSKAIEYSRPPDGFNHGLNDCYEAGRTVSHMHYHVMPRWVGDSNDPRGGVRHMFQGKGNYFK